MDLTDRKIVIIGAGAIGGTLAAFLAREKLDVTLVCRTEESAREISTGSGLHITGIRGEFTTNMKAVSRLEGIDTPVDYLFLAVKAGDLEETARAALPLLKPDSRVISLQNGICEELLASVAGTERTVGCTVGYGATMLSPGHLEMTSEGDFVIGYLNREDDARLEELKALMNLFIPTRISRNLMGALYSKLIINSCITTLGAVTGETLGVMLKKKRSRDIFIAVILEAMGVADALELEVEPYAGKLDWYRFRGWSHFRKHLFIRLFGFKYRRLKSSSLQSLERGKPTEVDFFNGYIMKKGETHGRSVPVNRALVELIHEIERGERRIGPDNFRAIPLTEVPE
jgi:2-dehydropantoate 2-reductase